MAVVTLSDIERTCLAALAQVGTPDANARLQVSLLLEAELRGHVSHGLLRLPRLIERIANGVADAATTGKQAWRGNLLDVDGQNGLGPVVAMAALDAVSERAREAGVAVAAIRDCNHLGMLAWYAEQIAARGQAVIGFTTSEALVHPWGGRQGMLGTNPIAIGVPAEPRPLVMDMATSIVSMGKVHDYANRGQPLPAGWALDADGDPTTDAAAAKAGSVAPFGGAKGYALGLAIELLVSSLAASAIGRDVVGTIDSANACNKGDLFIVLQPHPAGGGIVSGFLETLRQSASADPENPIRIPGERALARRDAALASGRIEVTSEIWDRITALAGF